MPKASEHKTKAAHNRRFLDGIDRDGFPDWAAVAAFYTAVHLVERVRAASGDGHSEGHDDRLSYVANNHGEIHTAYHILQNASMLARYQSRGDFFNQFQPEDVQQRLVDQFLAAIDAYVVTRLGD
ncbi:MAG: hypothetical protein K2V38_03900 [Gemmataceae bacterium]|nr:hypothetical protein [Gemmataceae bacterium]